MNKRVATIQTEFCQAVLTVRKFTFMNKRANVGLLDFRVVIFWNSMPEDIVSAPSVNSFKGRFDKELARLRYCSDIDYAMGGATIGPWGT